MDYNRKTGIQLMIERVATNQLTSYLRHTRSYQKVPYTKLFGQKFALKQWLLFSGLRTFNLYNNPSDETPLLDYLPLFIKHTAKKKLNETVFIMSYLNNTKSLEKKANPVNLESV